MDFYFLGTGNAFGHGGRRRSHYFWSGSENWLIDAGYDALAGLRSIHKDIRDVDKIFISHLHPDHYLSLPQFSLEDYYSLKREKPIDVFGPPEIKQTVLDATELLFNEEVTMHIEKLYNFHEISEGEEKEFENGNLKTYKADHSGNARMQLLEMDNVKIGYTGDTGFVAESFEKLLEAHITITEASSATHPIPQHTTLDQLLEYDIPASKKVYISHVGESTLENKERINPPLYLSHDGMKITF